MSDSQNARFASFAYRDFPLYLIARFFSLFPHHILIVGLSQYVYEYTRDPLYLGYIGLSIFVPKICFALFAGDAADRHNRRSILLLCRAAQLILLAALFYFFLVSVPSLGVIYVALFVLGITNAYEGPASSSLVPLLVPPRLLQNAMTWNVASMQLSVISGPLAAGVIYAGGGVLLIVGLTFVLKFVSGAAIVMLRTRNKIIEGRERTLESLLEGIRFVWNSKVLFGLLTLDLFAVLLGGAIALLPVYANEILHVGPRGLGMLRAAPAVGAAFTALALTALPPFQRPGRAMYAGVAVFGVSTVAFGLSTNLLFSLLCLAVLGAADMISVVVRHTLLQRETPDEMRGRVSAVNLIFIGASNELGEFESGLMAKLMGVVPSVVFGGVATLGIVAIWLRKFPKIWEMGAEPEGERPIDVREE